MTDMPATGTRTGTRHWYRFSAPISGSWTVFGALVL